MPVTFHIPGALRAITEGKGRVEIDASPATVGEALEALWARYPGVRDRIVNEQGQIRQHVNVFVGNENIRDLHGLDTSVTANAEISIIPAVSGGWVGPGT